MKTHPPEYFIKLIQRCLNDIATAGPDEGDRVARLHNKAKKYLIRLKEQHPDVKTVRVAVPKPEGSDVRRGASSPVSGSQPDQVPL